MRRSGSREGLATPASAGGTAPGSSEPGNPVDECGRYRPVPADVLSSRGRDQVEIQRIQRAGRGANGHIGDMQIACGGLQVGMAQQDLDGAEIDAWLRAGA